MTDHEDKKIEIDLRRRETEAGWNRIFDKFGLNGTPAWFNWISWLLTLAVLQYLYEKSRSKIIGAV